MRTASTSAGQDDRTTVARGLVTQKLATNYRRLLEPLTVECEYQGAHYGHPSTYGFVSFEASPAERLTVAFDSAWPTDFTAEYRRRVMSGVAEAIVDSLIASPDSPYRGCKSR
jgi:hypothetical protein